MAFIARAASDRAAPERRPSGRAPAKVNLTLHILARRDDGYHEIDSAVAFAGVGDRLEFFADEPLSLVVEGPTAAQAGAEADNLVLRAARALEARVGGLRVGRFRLHKRLPVAAGLGGGSSDAAAVLRALARLNGLQLDDSRLLAAARACGADVPVCLDPSARIMQGVGERVGPALGLPPLPAVLVNPRRAVPTPSVFAALGLARGESAPFGPAVAIRPGPDLMTTLRSARNDMQPAAIAIEPTIGEVLTRLSDLDGVELARMSGSGATCFALFSSRSAAVGGARAIYAARPDWWVKATYLR